MDGRYWTLLLAVLLPAALIGVTVAVFSSNPISILILLTIMIGGALYLLSYTDAF
jgi:hypothetical protein